MGKRWLDIVGVVSLVLLSIQFSRGQRPFEFVIIGFLAIIDVGAREVTSPLTHVILAGLFGSVKRLAAATAPEWTKVAEDERARWERDQPLLLVAEGVRAKRSDRAFASFAAP